MARATKATTIKAPFVLVADSREQRPYTFEYIYANASDGGHKIDVEVVRAALEVGDYSAIGFPGVIIERKSKTDLYGSIARRANFERRLTLMSGYPYAAVVVEADWWAVLTDPPPFAKYRPVSLSRTIIAWRQRFKVDWWFAHSRDAAEILVFRIIERFVLDRKAELAGKGPA